MPNDNITIAVNLTKRQASGPYVYAHNLTHPKLSKRFALAAHVKGAQMTLYADTPLGKTHERAPASFKGLSIAATVNGTTLRSLPHKAHQYAPDNEGRLLTVSALHKNGHFLITNPLAGK